VRDPFTRFDMARPPQRQKLRPIAWLMAFPDVWKHRVQIRRVNTRGLKPPYILLCNHNAFLDFKVTTAAVFPRRANYIVAIDGFIGREWLLRMVGCICKRKFTNDLGMIRHLQRVIRNRDILVIYPEARYSLCGTAAVLPDSLGKLCKLLKVPVAALIMHGHHVNSPFWNLADRGVRPTEADFTLLFTAEEMAKTSAAEINRRIGQAFQYDDFRWQKDRGIRVSYPKRAEGLHKVLYQCPACGREYRMNSAGARLFCGACGTSWVMGELGELSAEKGKTEFSHIPDWYEWERANVRRQVEEGTYRLACRVRVDSLPNAKRFIPLGEGTLVHDGEGFRVRVSGPYGEFTMEKPAPSQYSCHIEYDYLGKHGDCIDLNTLEDTWYIYPQGADFSVTKVALATEELYAAWVRGTLSAAHDTPEERAAGSSVL